MRLSSTFRSTVEAGLDRIASGAEAIARALPPVEPGRYLVLDRENGGYVVADELGFDAGFLAGKLWMLYDHLGREIFRSAATEVVRWCAILVPRTEVDIGFVSQYGPAIGYEVTGEAWMKEQALAGCASFVETYHPELGLLMVWPPHRPKPEFALRVPRKIFDLECYIDSAACGSALWWARRFDPRFGDIVRRNQDEMMRRGLMQPDGRVHHLLGFDAALRPTEFHTAQGYDDSSQWTRAQGWGMNSSVFAYEATGDRRYLETAVRICDYFLERMLPAGSVVPFYDVRDPRIPNVPRDTCSTALAVNVMVRLMQESPELESRYDEYVERAIGELFERHVTAEGVLLHGSWGNMHGDAGECVMPYGGLYLTEALYRLLRPGRDIWGIRPSPIQNGLDQARPPSSWVTRT